MRQKLQARIFTILWSTLKQAIVPILGLLFSLIITRKFSLGLWGELTQITILVSLISHLTEWGSTQYLLKEFSANPARLSALWQKCFIDRVPLLLIASGGILICFANTIGILVVCWCVTDYIYQSYEPIISFRKKFMLSVWAEIAGTIVLFFLLFVFRASINLHTLLILLILSDVCKAIIVMLFFHKDILPLKIQKPDFKYYRAAMSFFLLGFIGLVSSRTDLIYVTLYLNHNQIAFYQITTTFFSFIKGGAHMLILPFIPAIYRVKKDMIYKLSAHFAALGIIWVAIALVVVYFIVTLGYRLPVSLPFLLWGGLSIIPAFYTYSIVTFLFKINKQKMVVIYGVVVILVIFLLNVLLVPSFGTLGAIASVALAEWIVIPLYLYEMYRSTNRHAMVK